MNNEEYVCPISEQTAEIPDDGGPPIGWVVLTIQRRVPNPEYLIMVRAQQEEFATAIRVVPENRRDEFSPLVMAQIKSRWFGYSQNIPVYLTESVEVTLAPGETSEDVQEFLTAIYETTGMEPLDPLPLAPMSDSEFEDIDGENGEEESTVPSEAEAS